MPCLSMTLTRTQIDEALGNSIGGKPNFDRANKPLCEDLEYAEVTIHEGDYEYHMNCLVKDARHFEAVEGGVIPALQFEIWDHRMERWGDTAHNLKIFIRKVKRMHKDKELEIDNPDERNLFEKHQGELQPLMDRIDVDTEKMEKLRITIHKLHQEKKMEEAERGRTTNPQREPGQGPSQAKQAFRPVDSLKPPHALNYKMTIPEKAIWKELTLAWFEASGFETVKQPIQIQFMNQITRDDIMKTIQHKFMPEHSYKDFVCFAEEEFMLYHTLENNLSRLLSLKKKHSEKVISLWRESHRDGQQL